MKTRRMRQWEQRKIRETAVVGEAGEQYPNQADRFVSNVTYYDKNWQRNVALVEDDFLA